MTLGELLERLALLDDDSTIYVSGRPEEAREDTRAEVVPEPEDEDEDEPDAPPGMAYLLEVDHAKEAVAAWREWSGGSEPSVAERCRAVVHYAVYDAFIDPHADADC